MGALIWFGLGMIAASVIWFFVWRNNKELLKQKMDELDQIVSEKLDKKD